LPEGVLFVFERRLLLLVWLIPLPLTACSSAMPSLPQVDRPTAEGAVIGTLAGSYLTAQLALGQGIGNGQNTAPLIPAGAAVGALAGAVIGHWIGQHYHSPPAPEPTGPYSLIEPRARQFDLMIENLSGFTGPGSIVRVREFNIEGNGLDFPSLGLNYQQMPTTEARYWFNQVDALDVQFRYFNIGAHKFQTRPIFFNGSQIKGRQVLNTNPSTWFSLSIFYERRLRPFYQEYEESWPVWMQKWDLRAKAGIEYTYLEFAIDGGHAPVTSTSKGEETTEDFYHQSMPVPTIGLEAMRRIDDNFSFDGSVQGGWINRWNSLRDEGGIIWASQNGVEGHMRMLYTNRAWLGPVQPMVGFFMYHYSQLEDSHEDGNFIRWFSFGPEYGVTLCF
jgi:hypothetical protein